MELVKMKSGDIEIHFMETKQEVLRQYVDFKACYNGKILLQASGDDYSVPAMFENEEIANDIIEWIAYENEKVYDYVVWDKEECEQENRFIWEYI